MAKASVTERPKAVDALVGITEQAIAFRFADRAPSLSDVVRVVGTASRLLRYDNVDERIEVENATVLRLPKSGSWSAKIYTSCPTGTGPRLDPF